MKDLDFDELDKAVSSLMDGVTKTKPYKNDDVKTVTIEPRLADGAAASAINPPANAAFQSEPARSATPGAGQPEKSATALSLPSRPGRFMDVVRPSPEVKKPLPSQTPSRQGFTIEPRSPEATGPVTGLDTTDEPALDQAPAVGSDMRPTVEAEDSLHKSDWPDPLDMSHFTADEPSGAAEPNDEQPAPLEKNAELAVAEPADAPEVQETAEPLVSPFLADAKVEKRPLGGNLNQSQNETVEEPGHSPVLGVLAQEDSVDSAEDNQLPPKLAELPPPPLPEELRGDLMAIESDNRPAVHEPEPASLTPTPAPTAAPAAELSTEQAVKAASASSITQQYRPEPSRVEQPSGAVYDTVAYHQPLSHPSKKKSGWLWVVAVIAILLLGAASGAALYFLDIV